MFDSLLLKTRNDQQQKLYCSKNRFDRQPELVRGIHAHLYHAYTRSFLTKVKTNKYTHKLNFDWISGKNFPYTRINTETNLIKLA